MRPALAVQGVSMSTASDSASVPATFKKALRRTDELTNLAVIAAAQALAQARSTQPAPEEVGIFLGTAFGPLETNFRFLDTLLDDGEGQASPTLFSHSVYNTAAGYISRLMDLRGPALTLTSFTWPFLAALDTAWQFMARKKVRRALVVAVEARCALLEDVLKQLEKFDTPGFGKGAAVACVLDPGEYALTGHPVLRDLEICERPCDPEILLTRNGETWNGRPVSRRRGKGPLDHALAIVRAFTDLQGKRADDILAFNITSPFGHARLTWHINKT